MRGSAFFVIITLLSFLARKHGATALCNIVSETSLLPFVALICDLIKKTRIHFWLCLRIVTYSSCSIFLSFILISAPVSLICLAPHFRLLRVCEESQHKGDLEGIDALLGKMSPFEILLSLLCKLINKSVL